MIEKILSLQDVNIRETTPLVSPAELKAKYPLSDETAQFVYESRETVKSILKGDDKRVIAIVGPCSIHNPDIAVEYAHKLAAVAKDVKDRMIVIMRVYFEKPRTTVGWKGLINDPGLNDTFDMATGLNLARQILREVNQAGLPAATEMLEPITPQYIADLITLASIGARTTESPTHRQMASGLSMPVGFKNSTEGSLEVATNAMKAARAEHCFLGIDNDGNTCIVNTRGNDMGHLILRGGRNGPNYDAASLVEASRLLESAKLPPRFVVDCSHANSDKDYKRQPIVWNDVIQQRVDGNETIVGLMLESNLKAGQQSLGSDVKALEYGVSITDGCISFEQTEDLLRSAHEKLGG
ncbi:3-deoxy-7-phosphoheptulonate synthase [Fuerstiella marisgermanici]|uniref:Phospho-2-dehydro-3-deoxyheptonate aldolase n=1 Tax=Fuerstiella marisgermanici TaxID=1891926 RepID=A0A1P8WIL5_9PLAN|nr:3-deoxy-7-phosphoheptulonate synthase [Fuerstiella marisgermanici]APZ93900.1 Phospho-2-dehydro-3-deoxyheptonate aldolase, Tyr-sensitive [Fuerstiella marisgermanici]